MNTHRTVLVVDNSPLARKLPCPDPEKEIIMLPNGETLELESCSVWSTLMHAALHYSRLVLEMTAKNQLSVHVAPISEEEPDSAILNSWGVDDQTLGYITSQVKSVNTNHTIAETDSKWDEITNPAKENNADQALLGLGQADWLDRAFQGALAHIMLDPSKVSASTKSGATSSTTTTSSGASGSSTTGASSTTMAVAAPSTGSSTAVASSSSSATSSVITSAASSLMSATGGVASSLGSNVDTGGSSSLSSSLFPVGMVKRSGRIVMLLVDNPTPPKQKQAKTPPKAQKRRKTPEEGEDMEMCDSGGGQDEDDNEELDEDDDEELDEDDKIWRLGSKDLRKVVRDSLSALYDSLRQNKMGPIHVDFVKIRIVSNETAGSSSASAQQPILVTEASKVRLTKTCSASVHQVAVKDEETVSQAVAEIYRQQYRKVQVVKVWNLRKEGEVVELYCNAEHDLTSQVDDNTDDKADEDEEMVDEEEMERKRSMPTTGPLVLNYLEDAPRTAHLLPTRCAHPISLSPLGFTSSLESELKDRAHLLTVRGSRQARQGVATHVLVHHSGQPYLHCLYTSKSDTLGLQDLISSSLVTPTEWPDEEGHKSKVEIIARDRAIDDRLPDFVGSVIKPNLIQAETGGFENEVNMLTEIRPIMNWASTRTTSNSSAGNDTTTSKAFVPPPSFLPPTMGSMDRFGRAQFGSGDGLVNTAVVHSTLQLDLETRWLCQWDTGRSEQASFGNTGGQLAIFRAAICVPWIDQAGLSTIRSVIETLIATMRSVPAMGGDGVFLSGGPNNSLNPYQNPLFHQQQQQKSAANNAAKKIRESCQETLADLWMIGQRFKPVSSSHVEAARIIASLITPKGLDHGTIQQFLMPGKKFAPGFTGDNTLPSEGASPNPQGGTTPIGTGTATPTGPGGIGATNSPAIGGATSGGAASGANMAIPTGPAAGPGPGPGDSMNNPGSGNSPSMRGGRGGSSNRGGNISNRGGNSMRGNRLGGPGGRLGFRGHNNSNNNNWDDDGPEPMPSMTGKTQPVPYLLTEPPTREAIEESEKEYQSQLGDEGCLLKAYWGHRGSSSSTAAAASMTWAGSANASFSLAAGAATGAAAAPAASVVYNKMMMMQQATGMVMTPQEAASAMAVGMMGKRKRPRLRDFDGRTPVSEGGGFSDL